MTHLKTMLHDRARNPQHVSFLEGVFANQVTRHLTREYNHRYRIHVRSCDTRNGIGRTWSRRHQNNAGLTRRTRIGICSVSRCLLMTDQNMGYFAIIKESIVDM